MLYAILAYHVEAEVNAWSADEDAELMANLRKAHERALRGPGEGIMIDGPFAETKEQLLGFYVVDFPDQDAAPTRYGTCAAPIRARSMK